MVKYNLEDIKTHLTLRNIKGRDLWKLFGIEGKAQTKTKQSIIKQFERLCKFEKVNGSTFNIIEIHDEI
jgi:hypothetical protein